jgi:5'-3' exonuclease
METYRKYIGNSEERGFISPTDGKIQWKYVELFVSELAKMEHNLLLSEYSLRDKMDSYKWGCNTVEEKENALLNTPIIYRADEKYICPKEKFWEERYYRCLLGIEKTEESMKTVCVNYLEGLEWVFKYYTEGCPDWKWKYNYHYPPLFADLVKYIPKLGVDFINPSAEYNRPFSPQLQLAYVIPPPLHSLLLGEKNTTILKKYPQFYSESFEYKWAFCRYFWESHIVLPEISVEELHRIEGMLQPYK